MLRGADGDGISEECSSDFQKVMPCLEYATGKGNTPAKQCCDAVKDLQKSEPKCLCYIIQQAHNGSVQVKSLGIQIDRLLQLPSACQLQNASASVCPKLLGLSPTSPDAAIFTNTTATTPATPAGSSSPGNSDGSVGTTYKPFFFNPLAIAVALFIYTLY